MPRYLKEVIKDIRLVPMEYDTETIEQHQADYFENKLPFKENYWYKYYKSGIIGNSNDLLLFQYQNNIIASGLLDDVMPYKIEDVINKQGHSGVVIIQKGTLKTFVPISLSEFQKYVPNIEKFTQSKRIIDKNTVSNLDSLLDRLEVPRTRK